MTETTGRDQNLEFWTCSDCMNVNIGRCQPWRSTFNAFGVACSLEQSLLQSPFPRPLDMQLQSAASAACAGCLDHRRSLFCRLWQTYASIILDNEIFLNRIGKMRDVWTMLNWNPLRWNRWALLGILTWVAEDYADASHAVCSKLCNVWQLLERPPLITATANLAKVKHVKLLQTNAQLISLEEWLRCSQDVIRMPRVVCQDLLIQYEVCRIHRFHMLSFYWFWGYFGGKHSEEHAATCLYNRM